MKDNVELIHFDVKSRGVQGLVFMEITFASNIYFENDRVGVERIIVNL